jgi:hypothetical protein
MLPRVGSLSSHLQCEFRAMSGSEYYLIKSMNYGDAGACVLDLRGALA